ncbi:immunoglobulin domain-containing protein [Chitinophaga alhagiae]|uniref:immunoglobulin domain-containing protein n=1 Tax=Chitinophaga alhagiae TaxID=2203219 RepID=UPI000E5C180B|nr:hypothetical protein [Chitinophaga alhagiae]
MYAQCTRQERLYASATASTGNVADEGNAVDDLVNSASTISATLVFTSTQYLRFSERIAGGTPVTIKLTAPSGGIGVLSNLTLQAYTESAPGVRTNAGAAVVDASLLSVLTASGGMEYTFTPKTGAGANVDYDGVSVKLGGVNLTTVSMSVYHAFVMKNATADVSCNQVIDYLYGVKAAAVNLLTFANKVEEPEKAFDGDLASYAALKTAVGVLTGLYETVIFKTPSQPGDSLRIILKDLNNPVLTLALLNGFSVQPYLGQTPAGSPLTGASTLLNLRLLEGGTEQQYVLTAAIPDPFDRVEIIVAGLAGVARELRIYDVTRIAREPDFNFTVSGQPGSSPVCITKVNNVLYTITGAESCAAYRWYGADNTLLASGPSFTPTVTTAGTYTYYVAAQRTGCTNVETKKQLSLTVGALPGPPTLTIQTNP